MNDYKEYKKLSINKKDIVKVAGLKCPVIFYIYCSNYFKFAQCNKNK